MSPGESTKLEEKLKNTGKSKYVGKQKKKLLFKAKITAMYHGAYGILKWKSQHKVLKDYMELNHLRYWNVQEEVKELVVD